MSLNRQVESKFFEFHPYTSQILSSQASQTMDDHIEMMEDSLNKMRDDREVITTMID